MTLVGVGIDVASISRIGALLDRYGTRFEQRWFDPVEVDHPGDKRIGLASRFAVKEAVWKALPHQAQGPLPWRSIVTRVEMDARRIVVDLRGSLAREAVSHKVTSISASVQVNGDLVLAIALVNGD